MAKDIKQRIVLDGEKEYSAALKEVNRNLKTLKSELKAESAELGKNATEQQKADARAKSATKQIKEQEKAVKICEEALAKVKEEYADNEEVISKWERTLNESRATLAKMKDGLIDLGDGFKQSKSDAELAAIASKQVADAIGRISQVGDTVSDSIERIFTGMVGIISDAVGDVWDVITETAARANSWTDIAGWWNTDPQKIQQWGRALGASGKELNDMNNAVSKLAYGDHDKIRKLTGVSWAGDIDQWQYAADVLSSIASMDYTRKANALEELFGEKKASKFMDIVNAWGDIVKNLDTFNGDKSGYGMTTEGLETMNELDLKLKEIDEKWTALKDRIAEGLGKTALGLSVSVEGVMDGVADFLNAKDEGEREAALQKIRTNLEDFFTRLRQVVQDCIDILHGVGEELQNSDDPVTKAIGEILVGLTDALQWMIDHQNEVKTAFEVIFGAYLMAKLAAVAGKLLEITKNIEAIKAFKGFSLGGGAAGGAAGAGAGAGAAGAGSASAGAAKAGLSGMLKSVGAGIIKAVPYVAGIAALVTPANGDAQWDAYYDSQGNVTEAGKNAGLPGTEAEFNALPEADAQALIDQTQIKDNAETRNKKREEAIRKYLWRLTGADYTNYSEEEIRALVGGEFGEKEQYKVDALLKALQQMQASGEGVSGNMDLNDLMLRYGLLVDDNGRPVTYAGNLEGAYRTGEMGYEQQRNAGAATPTDAQIRAAEEFWDAYRAWSQDPDANEQRFDEAFDAYEKAFEGSPDLYKKIDELIDSIVQEQTDSSWNKIENLPAYWWLDADKWQGSASPGNGISNQDLRGLPAQLQRAAWEGTAKGVSGIKVYMDGVAVGRLVAPTVSQEIARATLG